MVMFLYLVFILAIALCYGKDSTNMLTERGKCKKLWRPDTLPGRCFGLSDIKNKEKFPELKGIEVKSGKDCRALCCNLGEKCVTWQFQNTTSVCKLGPPVRLGLEGAETDNWCEPNPPREWSGLKLASRSNGVCQWKSERLVGQCFGLGPEKKDSNGNSLQTSEQCQSACCADLKCDVWQHLPDRGCYFGNVDKDNIWCAEKEATYEGGRKCIPGFCGGLESVILGAAGNGDKKKKKKDKHSFAQDMR